MNAAGWLGLPEFTAGATPVGDARYHVASQNNTYCTLCGCDVGPPYQPGVQRRLIHDDYHRQQAKNETVIHSQAFKEARDATVEFRRTLEMPNEPNPIGE